MTEGALNEKPQPVISGTVARELYDALKIARPYVADMPIIGDDDLAKIDSAILRAEQELS